MYIFARNAIVLTIGDMDIVLKRKDIFKIIFEEKELMIEIKDIQSKYLKVVDIPNDYLMTISMDEFIKGYVQYNDISDNYSKRLINQYCIAEGEKAFCVGDKILLAAPLSDLKKYVQFVSIEVYLAQVTLIFNSVMNGDEYTITEPVNLSHLPEPHKDIINLPQYYIAK